MVYVLQDWYQVFQDMWAAFLRLEDVILRVGRHIAGHCQPWRPTVTVISWLGLQFCRFFLGWIIGALDNIILIVTWLLRFITYWRDLVFHWLGLF